MTGLITGSLDFVASFINSMLPVYDLSDSAYNTISTSLTTLADFIRQVNFIVPLSDIMVMIGIDIGIRIFKVTLFIGNWTIRRVMDVIP